MDEYRRQLPFGDLERMHTITCQPTLRSRSAGQQPDGGALVGVPGGSSVTSVLFSKH